MSEDKKIVDRIVLALGITKTELGSKFNKSKSVVHSWSITGIPSKYCAAIERMLADTADPLTRKELRPSDWQKWWPELAKQETESREV